MIDRLREYQIKQRTIDPCSKHPSSWGQKESLGVPRLSFGINTKYTSIYGHSSKGRGSNITSKHKKLF